MNARRIPVLLVAVSLVAGVLMGWTVPAREASAASARAIESSWSLSGSLSAPARTTESTVSVNLSGSITVPQTMFTTSGCDDTVTAPPNFTPLLKSGSGSLLSLGSGVPTITSPGSTSVSGAASVSPGRYDLVLRYRCGTGSWLGTLDASPPVSVSIATPVSTSTSMRACVADGNAECPSSSLPSFAVPSGTSIRFTTLVTRTWSDGVTTSETPAGAGRLEWNYTYSSSYWQEAASSCNTTISVTSDRKYRCNLSGTTSSEVTVNAEISLGTYVIGSPTLTPAAGLKGTPITVSATLNEKYTGDLLWPAPTGISYSLEFKQPSDYSWSTLSSGQTSSLGLISSSFTLERSGQVRFSIGYSATSAAVSVSELTRTGDFQVTSPSGPAKATPGQAMTISGRAQEKLSDGSFTAAQDGGVLDLEFALGYSAGDKDLVWSKAGTATILSGTATASVVPQYSGFWRFRGKSSVSSAVFVPVEGSRAIEISASATPVAGDVPFEGQSSRFTIKASLAGYVGTKPLTLFANLGGTGWVQIGSISAGAEVAGIYSLTSPALAGETTMAFQVRDGDGRVVGAGVSEVITVDGVASYLPKLTGPTRMLLDGESVTFTAYLYALTHQGVERPMDWSGSAELQRWDGKTWIPVKVLKRVSGGSFNVTASVVGGSTYRIVAHQTNSTSEPMELEVSRGPGRLVATWPDTVVVKKGLRVSAFVELVEGERWEGMSSVVLQFRPPSGKRWVIRDRDVLRDGRTVTMVAPNPGAGCYRVWVPTLNIEVAAGYGAKSCDRVRKP